MSKAKDVFTIIEREEGRKSVWVKIGKGHVNKDDSINIRLSALPVNGLLHIRNPIDHEG